MKVREIAQFLNGVLVGDGSVEITSVSDISLAIEGQIAFYEKDEPLPETLASCVIIRESATHRQKQVLEKLVSHRRL